MIGEFLACALALRPVSFPPIHDDPFFELFAEQMQGMFPGQEIWFMKRHALPTYEFDLYTHVKFRGYSIYVRKAA